ncbi:MAG: T9SS type A sorting domain-containing protein [Bacteroidales bacterium]|nr:T9SS type A sorting domain-containing protein [Bacteroidales bacterium]
MKKLNLFLLMLLLVTFSTTLSAQWLYSLPQPFTDSPSHKANAHLGYAYGLGWIVLWEQYTDTTSTAIWYKKYLTGDDPVELIAEPGIHFRRPTLISNWNDNSALVIFEKVSNGKSQLYTIEVGNNGYQSDTIPFWTSGYQNHELTTTEYFWVAWNSDEYLLASKKIYVNGVWTFSAPDTVAFGEISQPNFEISNWRLYWIEKDSLEDHIAYALYSYSSGWGAPQTLIAEPEISKKNTRWTHDGVVSWSYKNDEQWQINNYQYDYNSGEFYPLNLIEDEPFDFAVWSAPAISKSDIFELNFYTLAYPKVVGDYKELFAYEHWWGSGESYQLSFLNTECRNPSYHDGEPESDYAIYVYLIWEAEIEGFWQLYYSRFSFGWSNVEEHQLLSEVTISPNPAASHIFIQNQKEIPILISIYDTKGILIYENQSSSIEASVPVHNWPRGLYVVNILSGSSQLSKKIVLK